MTPLPVRAETPAPEMTAEHVPAPEPVEPPRVMRPPLKPRVLVLAGGAILGLGVVIAIAARGSSSASEPPAAEIATAPVVASEPARVAEAPATRAAVVKPVAAPAPPVVAPPTAPTKSAIAPSPPHKHHTSHAAYAAAAKHVAAKPAPLASEPVAAEVMDRARTAYNAGNEALFAGDSDRAIESYQQAIGYSPTLAFGHRGLGLAYAQKGDARAAIKAFRDYLQLAPRAKDAALIRNRIAGLQPGHH
jgi:hypothetical protein